MNEIFKQYIDKLPGLMLELNNSELKSKEDLQNVPRHGIYVMYDENKKPIYVGRSNNMKARLQFHSRPSAGHNSATFAFILAKEKADELGIDTKLERKVLEKQAGFSELFREAKARVSNMSVRTIGIDDQISQTLFEVYASLDLKTKYNDFGTH